MAQRPKESVRRALVAAAAEELAEAGYGRTTLAGVAARAGTSIGNLYRYFPGKEALFEAAVPPPVAPRLAGLLRARIGALGAARDAAALPQGHPYRAASEELLRFALVHRPEVLFLLERAEGSRYEGFREELVRTLARLGERHFRRSRAGGLTASERRALGRIYRAFVGTIAASLRAERGEAALREAVDQLSTYHLAGLGAFFAAAERRAGRRP